MNIEVKIKNSELINGRRFLSLIERNSDGVSDHVKNYFFLMKLIIGGTDFRSRTNEENFFFGLPVHNINRGIKIEEKFNKKIYDIIDLRAIELINQAKNKNKQIYVSWSGGIDSTTILVSLLKNSSESFKKNIQVVLSSHSILENIKFYKNHIFNKLNCHSYNSFSIDEYFLKNNIFLCGDLADCVFNSFPFERPAKKDSFLLEDKNSIVDILNTKAIENYGVFGIGEWFLNFLESNISASKVNLDLKTFNDYCWWININLKWNFESQRYLWYLKKNYNFSLDPMLISDYLKNVFFNTEDFQNWSYISLKNDDYKSELTDYIFNYDQDILYKNYKLKERGSPPNNKFRYYKYLPFILNRNYCDEIVENKDVYYFLSTL